MTGPEVFTNLCRTIWPVPEWRARASDFLNVRYSTVEQWGRGRRTYPPDVLTKLVSLARGRATLLDGAAVQAIEYMKEAA